MATNCLQRAARASTQTNAFRISVSKNHNIARESSINFLAYQPQHSSRFIRLYSHNITLTRKFTQILRHAAHFKFFYKHLDDESGRRLESWLP